MPVSNVKLFDFYKRVFESCNNNVQLSNAYAWFMNTNKILKDRTFKKYIRDYTTGRRIQLHKEGFIKECIHHIENMENIEHIFQYMNSLNNVGIHKLYVTVDYSPIYRAADKKMKELIRESNYEKKSI